MICESQLTTMFNSVQSDHKSLENALAAMNRELSALDAKREQYHPDFFAKKQSEIRDKFMPAIKATREKICDTSATMQTAAVFYESPAFYLSMQPLTSPVNGKIDQGTESIARLAKSTELSKMAPAMLELCAESAKQRGAWGELGMILAEAGSRSERVSIPVTNIPGRDQALESIRMAHGASLMADILLRESKGERISPVERLTAAREAMGPVTPLTDAEIARQRAHREGRA